MSFIQVSGLHKGYATSTGRIDVLRELELEVAAGELVAVVGASGVGKSTLLHVLGGLDKADAGQIVIDGTDVAAMSDAERVAFRNRRVGFVFQFHHLLPEFTALENAEMPCRGAATSDNRRCKLRSRVGGEHDRAFMLPIVLAGHAR